jgi:phenylacetate-CoA ligase
MKWEPLYLAMPVLCKRLAANLEGIRRNRYRRFGNYAQLKNQLAVQDDLHSGLPEQQIVERLNRLLAQAAEYTEFYHTYPKKLSSLTELQQLPLLTKEDLKQNLTGFISKKASEKELYRSSTSGSTGTPLQFYSSRESMRMSKAYYENYLTQLGITAHAPSARISSVKVVPYQKKTPPYWMYIDVYHQLQCSCYHISPETVEDYFKAFLKYQVQYGTGYASAWFFLAQFAYQKNLKPPALKLIYTDSEGMSREEQTKVEEVFDCPVYQNYGLSETNNFSVMCEAGNYHIYPQNAIVEITDADGRCLPAGTEGNIVVTDLNSALFPYIRYQTGDLGKLGKGPCPCGRKSAYLSQVTGRTGDDIILPDGRRVRLLDRVVKEGVGIARSQLIQHENDLLEIRVVPDIDFSEQSMEKVVSTARGFLGGQMRVYWTKADHLEQTAKGKVRYVIRRAAVK